MASAGGVEPGAVQPAAVQPAAERRAAAVPAVPASERHAAAALARIPGQPRVRDYFARAVAEGRLSHAYLFLGTPGSGQTQAAAALAECIVCPDGGCGRCDECIRVAHRTHPDVHWLAPEGAFGYVIDQVRSLIADVSLAPVRARSKVYVLEQADTLRDASANALLKTIEEPPANVTFVLMARSADAVLPTIVSRCQCVPFRTPARAEAAREVAKACGLSPDDPNVAVALSVALTPEAAAGFLRSPERRQARMAMVRALGELAGDDGWDVLQAAKAVTLAAKAPLDAVRRQQEEDAGQAGDFLSAKAAKLVEQRNKRELTARERSGIIDILAAAQSLLRDVLARQEHVDAPVLNADVADVVTRLSSSTDETGVLRALAAVSRAEDDVAHNVSPQLALEVMLCSCKEALCPPSYR